MATNYELAQLADAAYNPATVSLPPGWSVFMRAELSRWVVRAAHATLPGVCVYIIERDG